jgi:methylated-DNA-[protein]-cysteine S-methyltransferase
MATAHVFHAPMDSPIGRLWVAVSPRGLVSITRGDLPEDDRAMVDPPAVATAITQLEAFFAGRLRDFSLRLDLRGARAFDAAVWTATRQIPYGETVSYGELAAMAGHPGAARAAGNAMARCPLSPVVPCHRVVHADGSIGGWGRETWVKRWLLDLERSYSSVVASSA